MCSRYTRKGLVLSSTFPSLLEPRTRAVLAKKPVDAVRRNVPETLRRDDLAADLRQSGRSGEAEDTANLNHDR